MALYHVMGHGYIQVLSTLWKKSDLETKLENELHNVLHDMQQLSMVDEFSKYAKKERRKLKIETELKKYRDDRKSVSMKVKLGLTVSSYVLHVIILLGLIYNYRASPVIEVPEAWFWPLHSLIAFPTWVPGGVGVTVWLLVCRAVVRAVADLWT